MKKLISLLAVAVFTFLLAGCSGGNAPTAKSDSVLAKIKKDQVLTVGTDATFKPFEYKNNGKYEGFDIDLIEAVAKELGANKVEYVDTEFKGLIPGLLAKKYDLVVSAMYITDERKQTINFSDTYFPGGLSIMIKNSNTAVKGINDLKGKKVSVQIGTKSAKYLEEKYKDIILVKVETNNDMFMELETGKVDAVVTGLPAAKTYAKAKGTVKVLPETLTEEFYGYGLRKDDAELAKAVNAALKKVKDNGTYDQIVKKWFE
ncbi:glutamine ABC transporter substrate-binding protein [Anaerosporomusa subterranea]|uniref:Glutamine ABC transporter substrate-binding protein n=1 Tax=Anaerosporomusa subterranea TaxID=1794912 RepID=A0A154BQF9_ANASB|nr:transporter substrate-binding domain-containing protein [Anaerosporomusa subterranea]KYZ76224.1 glutamine ABC transporter substrate-binding protein [Anaerosporomusa subterranea]